MPGNPFIQAQRERHALDVASGDTERPSPDRLKSRALELGAVVGRWAATDPDTLAPETHETVVSKVAGVANLLRIDLSLRVSDADGAAADLRTLAGGVGHLSDAAEKIDHLEEYRHLADLATLALARWCLAGIPGATRLPGFAARA